MTKLAENGVGPMVVNSKELTTLTYDLNRLNDKNHVILNGTIAHIYGSRFPVDVQLIFFS